MRDLLVIDQIEPTSVDENVRIFEMSIMSTERRAEPRTLVYVNLSLITMVACMNNSNTA